MTHQEFFSKLRFKRKFSFQSLDRVQKYMKSQGFFEGPDVTPQTAAAAILYLGLTATESDLRTFGRQLLLVKTGQGKETLFGVLVKILSDPLDAATLEKLTFNRVQSKVEFEFVDGSYYAADLNLPVRPSWDEHPGIEFSQAELTSLAMDITTDNYIHQGERIK